MKFVKISYSVVYCSHLRVSAPSQLDVVVLSCVRQSNMVFFLCGQKRNEHFPNGFLSFDYYFGVSVGQMQYLSLLSLLLLLALITNSTFDRRTSNEFANDNLLFDFMFVFGCVNDLLRNFVWFHLSSCTATKWFFMIYIEIEMQTDDMAFIDGCAYFTWKKVKWVGKNHETNEWN